MMPYREIALSVIYTAGAIVTMFFGLRSLSARLSVRVDAIAYRSARENRQKPTMKNWKTTIGPGVIGSTDRFAWCHHNWVRPDSKVIPTKVRLDAMAEAAVDLRTSAVTATGKKPDTLATSTIVVTANRVVTIGCFFTIRDIPGEPGKVWVTSNLTNRDVANLDLASRCFLN